MSQLKSITLQNHKTHITKSDLSNTQISYHHISANFYITQLWLKKLRKYSSISTLWLLYPFCSPQSMKILLLLSDFVLTQWKYGIAPKTPLWRTKRVLPQNLKYLCFVVVWIVVVVFLISIPPQRVCFFFLSWRW